MATIRELLQGNDLWSEIGSINQFPFIDENINSLFLIEYGNLPAYSGFENVSVPEIANHIVKLYKGKWEKVIQAKIPEIFAKEVESKNKIVTEERDSTNNESRTEKVSGYNSTDLIDDKGSELDSTENGNKNLDETNENAKLTFSEVFNNLSTVEQMNLTRLAMLDVANFLKTHIY